LSTRARQMCFSCVPIGPFANCKLCRICARKIVP
jgi:hypothetical protein